MKEFVAWLATFVLIGLSLSGCRSTNEGPADTAQGDSQLIAPVAKSTIDTTEDRDKALQTMKAMRIMAMTCEAYAIDYGRYPKAGSPEALAELVTPVYIKTLDMNDAWGNEFEVRSSKSGYELRSYGRDGNRDKHAPAGMTGDLDADIVFSDVRFTQAPFED